MVDEDPQGFQGSPLLRRRAEHVGHLEHIGAAEGIEPGRGPAGPIPIRLRGDAEAWSMVPFQPPPFRLHPTGLKNLLQHVVDMGAGAAAVEGRPEQGEGRGGITAQEGQHAAATRHIRKIRSQLVGLLHAAPGPLTTPQPHQLIRLPAVQAGQGRRQQGFRPRARSVSGGEATPPQKQPGQPFSLLAVVKVALIKERIEPQGQIGIQFRPVHDRTPEADRFPRRRPLQRLLTGQPQQRSAQSVHLRHGGEQLPFSGQQQPGGSEQVLLPQVMEQLEGENQSLPRSIPSGRAETVTGVPPAAGGQVKGDRRAGGMVDICEGGGGGIGVTRLEAGPGTPDGAVVSRGGRPHHPRELTPGVARVALQQVEHPSGPVDLLGLKPPRLITDQVPNPLLLAVDQQHLEIGAGGIHRESAGFEALLEQRLRLLRLALIQPKTGQQEQRLGVEPQVHGPGQGGFGTFGLPFLQRLTAFHAPEMGFPGRQLQIRLTAQRLLTHPDGIAVAATGHQISQLALQGRVLATALGRGSSGPGGHRLRGDSIGSSPSGGGAGKVHRVLPWVSPGPSRSDQRHPLGARWQEQKCPAHDERVIRRCPAASENACALDFRAFSFPCGLAGGPALTVPPLPCCASSCPWALA